MIMRTQENFKENQREENEEKKNCVKDYAASCLWSEWFEFVIHI